MIFLHDDISVSVLDILAGETSGDTILKALNLLVSIRKCMYIHSRDLILRSNTVCIVDDELL